MGTERDLSAAPSVGVAEIRQAIDAAESDFRRCWTILCDWKGNRLARGNPLFDFQPRLANALFGLEKKYNDVAGRRDYLISTKSRRSPTVLSNDLRRLRRYADALMEAMSIGRSLGDAFAWPFYSNSPEILRKHLDNPIIGHFPTGKGGRGEIEFIRHAKAEKHFLLHHGITSSLRVGDLSFVDPTTWVVAALGELKTHDASPGRLNMTLHIIAGNSDALPKLFAVPGVIESGSMSSLRTATPKFMHRLEAQMKKMRSALPRDETRLKSELFGVYYTSEMSQLAENVGQHKVAYARFGSGGVLVALRPFRGKTLSSRLFSSQTGESIAAKCRALPGMVVDVADSSSLENSLFAGGIRTSFSWGALPFFWWPLDLEFLQRFYFGEVVLFSCYNPVHLFSNLRSLGFDIKGAATKDPVVTRRTGDVVIESEHFSFFVRAVGQHLMREDKVVEIFARLGGGAAISDIPAKIMIDIVPKI
jgi:hypothetical protein